MPEQTQLEHQNTVAALKSPKRRRPVVAILALNRRTEISDFLTTYGVLAESGLADITVVADRPDPIELFPSRLSVDTQAITAQFDVSHPDGADYVIVPAMEPHNDPAVIAWITAQYQKGAKIVSVCDGSLILAAAGLLDDRRATGHWYSIKRLQTNHPTMTWVRDRRYVVDRGVATSTGITASIPLMMALVEAIGGRAEAETLSMRLGVDDWHAGHDSSAFGLTSAHKKTFLRNKLSFWRYETVGVRVDDDVDEISLGLMADAYARTELATVKTIGGDGGVMRSRRGLRLRPSASAAAKPNTVLAPPSEQPARTLDHTLPRIAARYDPSTAAFVALVMEYPWSGR